MNDVTARLIRTARAAKNWRQQDLADATGFDVQSIRNWESGARPRAEAWRKLAEALDIHPIRPRIPMSREQMIEVLRKRIADENGVDIEAVKFTVTITT